MPALPLFEETFLRAQWSAEFDAFESSPESAALLTRLRNWANRDLLNERASETAFIQRFFAETWGYHRRIPRLSQRQAPRRARRRQMDLLL